MTHDELLEELNYAIQEYDKAYDNTNYYYTALRAVVELHKPNHEGDECSHCGWECGGKLISFPCDTIQAIEKELS